MHNDEPALRDTLERGALIEEVGKAIAKCEPPQVFGVHGDWGLGKTSFLHQVQWYLTGDCPQQPESATKDLDRRAKEAEKAAANGNDADGGAAEAKGADGGASTQRGGVYEHMVQAVWFDAWRYQNEEAPVVVLLHEMRAQLSWRSRAAVSATRAEQVLTRGALLSLEELTKKIGFQYSKFRQASREWESENLAAILPSHTLREHLCETIRQLLTEGGDDEKMEAGGNEKTEDGEKERRLVVFIDDVDRCEPEAAYRLLEGLKIYLTLDNCVFVLGMNQKAIEEAIAQRMKVETGDNPTMRAAAYMEKLCQNVWRLPAVRQPEQVLCRLLEETVESEFVRELVGKGLEVPRSGEESGESTYQCLPPSPRRLKGLANLIGRLSPRLPSRDAGLSNERMVLEARLLLIVAYIYQFHHDLHVRWDTNSGFYNRIHDWCLGTIEYRSLFKSLELPLELLDPGPDEETPPGTYGPAYPDPTQASIFWIQPLILHIGNEIAPQRFERYLHGESV